MEASLKNKQEGALADSVGAIFGVGLLLAAAIMAVGGIHWIVWGGLIVAAFVVVGVERIRR